MPVSTSIDTERRLVINTAWGTVSDEDFIGARRDLSADPRFDASLNRLWDFSNVTREDLSEGIVAELVSTSPSGDHVYRAVVCSMPATVPRVMEFIVQSRRLSRRIAVFPTREDAEIWIQSKHRPLPPVSDL
jgi:hypothetical protein